MVLTRGRFIEEISELSARDIDFNVSSSDSGNVNLYLRKCVIRVNESDGINGEVIVYKPNADMEVTIDFAIVEEITKQDNIYTLSFKNGLADVDIEVIQ